MSNYNTIMKASSLSRLIVLLFLGIAIQSVIIFPQVLTMLKQNQVTFLSWDVMALYWVIAIFYSLTMTLFLDSRTFISPFYIQIGTTAFFLLLIMVQAIVLTISLMNVIGILVVLAFVQFGSFILVGWGLSLLFRRLTGMYADPNEVCNKTYRVDCNYEMVKKIFKAQVFQKFIQKESEDQKQFVLNRKRLEIRTSILLEPDNKDPTESIISISTCQIKYDSIWKTKEAEDEIEFFRKIINSELYEMYSRRLTLDENEQLVSNRGILKLLETMESSLMIIGKLPKKTLFGIGFLSVIGTITTILKFTTGLPFPVPTVDWNTLISVWAIVISTAVLLNVNEIRGKLTKSQ